MSKPIIEIENIGKRYKIGSNKEQYVFLRDEIVNCLSPAKRRERAAREEFWALRNITFGVEQGEVVGIIGRNGAGKSTLLKVLSQITPPTEGRIKLRGRVASLLEVGTGFHPELTGRENIYLNGAILGMMRKEIARKFDEIVAFAEVEKFLDTPVKRYSSGMYVRLAFAVAAHLEPEILVVDEVLAVGDSEFQKKCLGKMGDVAKCGRTVLFVSHNMAALQSLCQRGIVLSSGVQIFDGTSADAVAFYHRSTQGDTGRLMDYVRPPDCSDASECFIEAVWLDRKEDEAPWYIGDELKINLDVFVAHPAPSLQVTIGIRTEAGVRIYHSLASNAGCDPHDLEGRIHYEVTYSDLALYPGKYYVEVWLGISNHRLDYVEDAAVLEVEQGGPKIGYTLNCSRGMVHEVPKWSCSRNRPH